MEGRYTPTPEDRAPEHPELQETNEEFLERIADRLDQPYSWDEQKAQYAARREQASLQADMRPAEAEPYTKTIDKMDEAMESRVAQEQLEKLDENGIELIRETEGLMRQIGEEIISKRGDEELVQLSREAQASWDDLRTAYKTFKEGAIPPESFIEAVAMTHERLEVIERRISSHP